MLLVNQKSLPSSGTLDKTHEMYGYWKEYHEGIKKLKDEFPVGTIKLNRIGYPKKSNGMAKPVPRFICPMEWMADGPNGSALWSYCEGTPKILANGLAEIPEKHFNIDGADLTLDWRKNPDFAFFIMFKTPLVKQEGRTGMDMFAIKDPEREAMKRAESRRSALELSKAIYDGLVDENKLRIVAASCGIDGAYKDAPDVIRERLEAKILADEAKKSKEPNNLSLRGIKEFLKDVDADTEIRRRALVQYALDNKKLYYDKTAVKFKTDERDVANVPTQFLNERVHYLAHVYFGAPNKKGEWETFLRECIDEDMINAQDKRGLAWVAGELGLETEKKKIEEIRADLLGLLVG